ncbi:hypothetical protein CTA2_8148 [Colletotrichum tanaceti]|nr:hypothetical protein CTA2_8148 [Colletotrichum tanaceti]
MRLAAIVSTALAASAGVSAAPLEARSSFVEVPLPAPQNWSAGGSLFPGQLIAAYHADAKDYTANTWSAYVLEKCKGFTACTSSLSYSGGDDIDATPRPSRQSERSIERISTPSITSTSTTSSRTSSPSKQLKRLALEPDGFVHRMMSRSRTHLPASLASLKAELKAINDGFRLLPHTKRAEFVDFDIPDHAFLAETDPDPDGIRYPSRDTVAWLFDQAEECEINSHGEPSWNTELHLPMMEWALRPDRRRGLVDYTYCTGAQVAKSYKPRRSPSNMIDFCMVIRPPDESPEAHRIDAVRYRRPDVTINHTDHGILCKSPIAVSFETKRPGADIEKATVQMGTWHAAQWRGIFRDLTRPPALEFLPGVVISGHTWTFVASTFENGKCVYYSGAELGKTSDEIGIIKVLIALQHLASWAQNTYWPAFKFDLLDL